MKQIFKTYSGIKCYDVEMPTPGEREILVKVCSSVVSTGTETMGMKKNDITLIQKIEEKKKLLDKVLQTVKKQGVYNTIKVIRERLDPKELSLLYSPLGYSNSGIVISKGQNVLEFNVGDKVACAGAGLASHAEYVTIPVNLAVKVSDEVDFKSSCFATVGAIAMQGIRRANISFGETIVVFGAGLIGLLGVQIAKTWGLNVIAIDLNDEKLKIAAEYGADLCINAKETEMVEKVNKFTSGAGADAVIIYAATSSSEPVNNAFKLCRRNARVVGVGSFGMNLHRDDMYLKELDFVMSTSYGPGRYDDTYELRGIDYPIGYVRWTENRNMKEFIRLLETNKLEVNRLISKKFEIFEAEEAYTYLVKEADNAIAVLFDYKQEENKSKYNEIKINPYFINNGKINVGIIGAGGFIQTNHLANILAMPNEYEIIAIADKTPASTKTLYEKYKPKYITTDYNQLLQDELIDLVIIGTRHNLHAEQVINSIKAGKNVLVEKPLAINQKELDAVHSTLSENNNIIAAIGFNRRYSPLTQSVLREIESENEPIVINYRINAGFFPPDIWIQKLDEGAGRIVGEVCHFIDLVIYLARSEVNSVGAIHIPINGKIEAEDNIIVSLSFKNGSIGVITYAANGGGDMGKERIEIFSNKKSYIIDDFKELITYNAKLKGYKKDKVDKGHKNIITEMAKKLKGDNSLILPFDIDIKSTQITLDVLDIIHNRCKKKNIDNP